MLDRVGVARVSVGGMSQGPRTSRVREELRRREDRPEPEPTEAGPDRIEDRAREMRDRVEPPAPADEPAEDS